MENSNRIWEAVSHMNVLGYCDESKRTSEQQNEIGSVGTGRKDDLIPIF